VNLQTESDAPDLKRAKERRGWLAIIAILCACSCRPAQRSQIVASPPPSSYGYLVVGATAVPYGFVSGDTLWELRRRDVPTSINEAARQQVAAASYDTECTRFFRSETRIIALMIAECRPNSVLEDGRAVAVFQMDSSPVGALGSPPYDFYTGIHPVRRPPW
jgi:hypothetical protein